MLEKDPCTLVKDYRRYITADQDGACLEKTLFDKNHPKKDSTTGHFPAGELVSPHGEAHRNNQKTLSR